MIDCAEQMLVQLIKCIPVYFGISLLFDFIGDLLFRR